MIEEKNVKSFSVIEDVNLEVVNNTMTKIAGFQSIIKQTLKEGHDYGIIRGTSRQTLLKAGAEKIIMLLGLRSEFEVVEQIRDYEKGFFAYEVCCRLYKDEVKITEGLGHCNTKENKYVKLDGFSVANTVLKMAKKRSLVDASLTVASLSDIFTQDMEDLQDVIDKSEKDRVYTDGDGTITKKQAGRMFAIARGEIDIVKEAMAEFGYDEKASSQQVKKVDYDKVCEKIEVLIQKMYEDIEKENEIKKEDA